jgi:hypothetical protein
MERAAAVDHVVDRQHRSVPDLVPVEEGEHLVERALGEWRGDQGNEDEVGGAQHLLAGIGQAGRCVEDDPVIVLAEPLDQLEQPLLLVEIVQEMVEPAQRSVGRQQVEPRACRSSAPACRG